MARSGSVGGNAKRVAGPSAMGFEEAGASRLLGPAGPRICASRLMTEGGYVVLDDLADAATFRALLREAVATARDAVPSVVGVSDGEDGRGGKPSRKLLTARGGPVQDAFYLDPRVLEVLEQTVEMELEPSGPTGSYSYYARSGDHLAVHRDIEGCDLAVNTCLSDNSGAHSTGGMLEIYPGRVFERLSSVRRSPNRGVVRLRLRPGQTIALFGGAVPHAVVPMDAGEVRIMSVLCYRMR